MITFEDRDPLLILVYVPDDLRSPEWVDEKLARDGNMTISRVLTVQKMDLLDRTSELEDEDPDGVVREFVIGRLEGQYRVIRAGVLGLQHDLKIAKSVTLSRAIFVAERGISIFGRIDDLVDEQIVVGGDEEGAIPEEEFARLLRRFPTTTELRLYSSSRVARILGEYVETMTGAEAKLAEHMARRDRALSESTVAAERFPAANELELEKFTFVRDRIEEMLKSAEEYSEAEWQRTIADLFLLIFPQYVAVLQKVRVRERYSKKPNTTDRELDLVLVAASGAVDILEIKKPFTNGLMSVRQYRDNYVPLRELSGTIMQVEKYLFYLSKSGPDGEERIAKKYKADLPAGLEIKIANPKAFILSGRDDNFTVQQAFDFEFVRRKYSNVVDIITYDDLLRRLDNILSALRKRTGGNPGE
jgi:hypothetical protein